MNRKGKKINFVGEQVARYFENYRPVGLVNEILKYKHEKVDFDDFFERYVKYFC